ncbi:hypothetical protein CR513_44220, partial [Mucuna pruriens]
LGTEKPKVIRGDRLEHQRTLEDGIIESRPCLTSVLIPITFQPPLPTAFKSETEIVCLCNVCLLDRDHLGSVSMENNSAYAELLDKRSKRLKNMHYQGAVDNLRLENQLTELTSLVRQLTVGQHQPSIAAKVQPSLSSPTKEDPAEMSPSRPGKATGIQYPQLEPAQTYELKSSLIHLLPKFHGIPRGLFQTVTVGDTEGLHQNEGVSILLGWSREGLAVSLASAFQTWGDMKHTFLEKFFPASRTASIRKQICGIRQHTRETLHEYWERFNKLCATCPHHQISEQLLIQYFYEGISMMDRSLIDAVSGGALMDKTLAAQVI